MKSWWCLRSGREQLPRSPRTGLRALLAGPWGGPDPAESPSTKASTGATGAEPISTLRRKTAMRLSGDDTAPARPKESGDGTRKGPVALGTSEHRPETREHRGSQTQACPEALADGGLLGTDWPSVGTKAASTSRRGQAQPETGSKSAGGNTNHYKEPRRRLPAGMQRATCYPGLSGEACTEGPANPETEATAQDGLSMKSLTRAGRGSRWSRPRPVAPSTEASPHVTGVCLSVFVRLR